MKLQLGQNNSSYDLELVFMTLTSKYTRGHKFSLSNFLRDNFLETYF